MHSLPGEKSKFGYLLRSAIVSGFIALLVLELGLWVVVPLADPYAAHRSATPYLRRAHVPNLERIFVPEPGLPGMEGSSRFTTNNYGFRGDDLLSPKPDNEYRIFLVGGSSMESSIVDDDDSIEAVVQRIVQEHVGDRREIKVYNAGMSGDRSDDHVAILTQRIAHLEPDFVVVFAGINDLRAGIEGHDYLHFPTPAKEPWILLVTQSQIGRLAYYLTKGRRPLRASAVEGRLETQYRVGVQLQNATKAATAAPATNIDAYANNLRTIAGFARGHDLGLIFMTQQTTWNSAVDPKAKDWHWLLRVGDMRYSEADMDQALETMNDAMREIAVSRSIPLYDLAKDMPKSTEFFYDDVHFNTNGARVAGETLSVMIIQHLSETTAPVASH